MTTVTIMVAGAELKVSGTYRREHAATLEQPGEPESFDVDSVLTEEAKDITDLIGKADMEEISGLALAEYKEAQAVLADEAADHRRDYMTEIERWEDGHDE